MTIGWEEGESMFKTTACVIVRNEEENLPQWIKCMQKLVDEMVVVDTGSSDNTILLAKQAGARVYEFPWVNDFAAAKNYAISKAEGEWIYFLDADEYFQPSDFSILRKTLRQYDKKQNVIGFVCRLINIDKDDNNRVLNENLHIRIFRNLPELRYVGEIHEQLVYSGQGKKEMILMPKAIIYHTGYSARYDIIKGKRNLDILLAQKSKGQGKSSDICYIADAYYSMKDYTNAAKAAQKAVDEQISLPGRETRMYSTLIQSLHLLGNKWQELLPIVKKAENQYPYVPDFRALLGFAAWQQGAQKEARIFFLESKKIYQKFLQHRNGITASYPDEMKGMLPKIEKFLAMNKNKTKLSAAVIVKNEENDLPIWLECTKKIADEVIVVDTGSTDKTVEVATKAGAKVFHFVWIDDFAAAKNYAIEQCSGDWILMLDADEYIKPEDYGQVRKIIDEYDEDKSVIGFACELINIDKNKQNAYISSMYQIRLFRRMPNLRYVRAIHEMLSYTGKGKKTMPLVDAFTIYHTGYSENVMMEKFQRNLQMLELSVEKYGKTAADDAYFADCYYGLQRYEEAITHAKAYIDDMGKNVGGENRPYGIWIESLILLDHPIEEITNVVNMAMEKFPYSAEFKVMEGHARYSLNDYIGAEKSYLEATNIYDYAKKNNIWRKKLLTDEAGAMMPNVYCKLCQLLLWQGQVEKAKEYLHMAFEADKYFNQAFSLLLKFLDIADDITWIETINSIYDKKIDATFILSNLPRNKRDTVRLYYVSQVDADNMQEKYMLAGRIEAAGAAVAEEMGFLCQMMIRSFAHDEKTVGKLGVLLSKQHRAVVTGKLMNAAERCLANRTARIQAVLAAKER